ncbi:hypothetical protein HanXRQr2_Chr10g0428511 [Helianthus annuus]|uniref:Uncharacterized protein n=1 Tax=Helianthus annuus TaxID=4232 RepID=A0A251TI86_HELAN|nr:hypothetical protein HanXRQr2_Chr10g0428511 [Helianthus annuus]KAJ0512984.1 hypothetical protein HanHA300_Chr10g0352311 [Helianthus annuus]KAJ0520694.1 hypothetical protein HanIR_Chr10g0462181 [Helianthus annuus]KAJ0529105.1 hypothetical protein HanHA89_Chr10g0373971 [Helianthus annuus]
MVVFSAGEESTEWWSLSHRGGTSIQRVVARATAQLRIGSIQWRNYKRVNGGMLLKFESCSVSKENDKRELVKKN